MLLRQASEWGMCGLQGSFLHCKRCLPTDGMKQRIILESIILIHNYRTEIVGCNQIKPVFDPEYERSMNIEGYDWIDRYYIQSEDCR